jgi:hypothetical protein
MNHSPLPPFLYHWLHSLSLHISAFEIMQIADIVWLLIVPILIFSAKPDAKDWIKAARFWGTEPVILCFQLVAFKTRYYF